MKKLITAVILFSSVCVKAQIRFSIASDLSLLRNFSPKQKFWALGSTIRADFHFTKKETAYAWIAYYTPGNFSNHFLANAKSQTTSPASIPFNASARWSNNEFSLGWRHYFKGAFDGAEKYSIYSTAGFGLMFTRVENIFTPSIDTSLYNVATLPGKSDFYRLTLDLGLGAEFPIGANFFLYGDVRTWIPTSDYPSPYLHNNKNVPLPFMISGGMRILFGY